MDLNILRAVGTAEMGERQFLQNSCFNILEDIKNLFRLKLCFQKNSTPNRRSIWNCPAHCLARMRI
jgi:hypothetical protein